MLFSGPVLRCDQFAGRTSWDVVGTVFDMFAQRAVARLHRVRGGSVCTISESARKSCTMGIYKYLLNNKLSLCISFARDSPFSNQICFYVNY